MSHNGCVLTDLHFKNMDKTSFVLFHSPRKKPDETLSLFIENKSVRQTNSVKYLGVLTLKLAGYFAKHIQARGGGGSLNFPQEC